MAIEVEAKILEVDKEELCVRLRGLAERGQAHLIFPERTFEACSFDHRFLRIKKRGWVIRLRREMDKAFGEFTFKGRKQESAVSRRVEYNLRVPFLIVFFILTTLLRFRISKYRQKRREEWQARLCKVEIDTFPGILTYVEIEGPGEESIAHVADDLGLDRTRLVDLSATGVLKYYGLPKEGKRSFTHIEFD